jgi:hypothetical protein
LDGEAEILCHNFARGLRQKISDAERVIFREISVIEDQDEVALPGAESLNRMTIASGKVPDIACIERIDISRSVGMEDRGTARSGDDIGPLGRVRMPMQLANGARAQPNRDTGNAGRNGNSRTDAPRVMPPLKACGACCSRR